MNACITESTTATECSTCRPGWVLHPTNKDCTQILGSSSNSAENCAYARDNWTCGNKNWVIDSITTQWKVSECWSNGASLENTSGSERCIATTTQIPNCATINKSSGNCDQCSTGYTLVGITSQPRKSIPITYCRANIPNCVEHNASANCVTCATGYTLHDSNIVCIKLGDENKGCE